VPAVDIFANQPGTTVSSGGTTAPSSGTTEMWTVASSSTFPAASSGASPPTQFHVADTAEGYSGELILVTNVSGTTWSVTRGAESTTTVAHLAGFSITQVVSAGGLAAFAVTGSDLSGQLAEVVSTHLSAALPVAQGGTGQESLTAYELLAAGTTTTGAVQQVGAGTSGQALTSGGSSALPSFGTLGIGAGGTGQTTQQNAINALAGATTSQYYLRGNGTAVVMSAIQAVDVPTLNQNTAGNAATATNLAGGATLPDYLAPAVVSLTFGSSIAVNAAAGNDFRVTLTSSAGTFASPSSPVDGQRITFQITQGSGGSFSVAWNAVYDFGAAGTPSLSTTAGDTDIIGFIYNAAKTKWCCCGAALGF
jgi:hypothetical protein